MPYFQVSFWGACASFLFNISLRRFYFFQMLLLQMDMCRFYSKIKRILLKMLSDCAMLFQNAYFDCFRSRWSPGLVSNIHCSFPHLWRFCLHLAFCSMDCGHRCGSLPVKYNEYKKYPWYVLSYLRFQLL